MQGDMIELQKPALFRTLRDLFVELGGAMPPRVLAEHALSRNIIPADVLATCQHRGLTALCRDALKGETEDGLPFAKPTTGEKGARWAQLELFSSTEFESLLARESQGLMNDHRALAKLQRWGEQKFGRTFDIPELREVEGTIWVRG
jgi:hypothetical protein